MEYNSLTKEKVLNALRSNLLSVIKTELEIRTAIHQRLEEIDMHSREAEEQFQALVPQREFCCKQLNRAYVQVGLLKRRAYEWGLPKDKIDFGSLMEYTFPNGKKRVIILLPFGGQVINCDGIDVAIVSGSSPLGSSLLTSSIPENIKVIAY